MKVLNQAIGKNFAIYHGDSCEVLKGIPDNSIHYSVTSIPFASLYTYSNSDRDMGNCRSYEEFAEQYMFLGREWFRESSDEQRAGRVYRDSGFPGRCNPLDAVPWIYLSFRGLHLEESGYCYAANEGAWTAAQAD